MSFDGKLLGIYVAARHKECPARIERAQAVAGRGLEGDRHFLPEGKDKPDKEVTLIEVEALRALAADYGITLSPEDARRNLLTEGTPLNHLVGREFRVGDVVLRGIRLCEPCGHLESLTCAGVQKGLAHRGGLRAQIVVGGPLGVGDRIVPADASATRR